MYRICVCVDWYSLRGRMFHKNFNTLSDIAKLISDEESLYSRISFPFLRYELTKKEYRILENKVNSMSLGTSAKDLPDVFSELIFKTDETEL